MWRLSTMQKRKLEALETFFYLFLLVLAVVCLARTATAHDIYGSWMKNDGTGSCCNDMDCAPAEVRIMNKRWEVKLHGHWVPVPDEVILKKNSPDGQAHVCNKGVTILCFVEPILA